MVEALAFGHVEIKKIITLQKELASQLHVEKRQVDPHVLDKQLYSEISSKIGAELRDALTRKRPPSWRASKKVDALRESLVNSYPEEPPTLREEADKIFSLKERTFRDDILDKKRRPDGRVTRSDRSPAEESGSCPHSWFGSFTRGETQALVIATLGTSDDAQKIDIMEGESSKRFMLHYNFPPFSVGEVAFLRGPGRREVGHGALAERAILPIIPAEDKFPYTIRIVSDILESNGSSSMASICGGVLSLMDAGVPIKAPVAGVAMGLVKEGDKYAILTDMPELRSLWRYGLQSRWHKNGITALQ
jgi:polyribonucleotide nucleotidyltransferase